MNNQESIVKIVFLRLVASIGILIGVSPLVAGFYYLSDLFLKGTIMRTIYVILIMVCLYVLYDILASIWKGKMTSICK